MKNGIFVRLLACLCICLAAESCRSGKADEEPDYGNPAMWYTGGASPTETNADVFYVAPTCNWGWTDEDGNARWLMDVYDETQRGNLQEPLKLAERVFAAGNRFYAPYYRQITMESWFEPDSVIERRFATAMEDVARAFDYYLEKLNDGRPFVLAGHSQGAKCIIELLKTRMDARSYERLVAAYAVGYEITEDDLAGARFLVPAADSLDTGVAVCFNSVADTAAVSPLFRRNRVCINPLNWRTDDRPSLPEENRGTVFLNPDGTVARIAPVSARIDTTYHTLVVEGLDPAACFMPEIEAIAPEGNYHVQELNIYFGNLQHNVARRVQAYYAGRRAAD